MAENIITEKNKKRRRCLSSEQLNKFIDVWRNYVQELRKVRKNNHVIKEMQKELKEVGIDLDPKEIRTRINNLTKRLR